MKLGLKKTGSFLLAGAFILNGCSSTQKPNLAADPSKSAIRSVASTEESLMEENFQTIIQNPQAERLMIAYADKLFDLLIEINRGIVAFDQELDMKLATKKANPSIELEEPLQSKTYARLWKMWQIRDKYTAEISWFYLRLLQMRTDTHLPASERQRIRGIHKAVGRYLKATQDVQRVELQPLMQELSEIFKAFVENYRAERKGLNQGGAELSSTADFSQALFGSHQELRKYIATRKIKSIPTFSPASEKRRTEFLRELEADLAKMPDPIISDRDPQSVQDLTCDGGKKLCASANDNTGNIVGKVFPAGVWALTYDDGPGAKSTGDLLEVLRNHRDAVNPVGKATFFWLAQQVQKYPNWVAKAVEYKYPIENHSYSHANLATLNTAGRRHEIVESNRVLTAAIQKVLPGYKVQYFRCPYGSCYAPKVPEARQMIANQGQIHAYWRVDSLDWKLLNGPKVADIVIKQMQLLDHGVVLMHDIHPSTIDATKRILAWLKTQNSGNGTKYKLVTIPEAVDMVNGR